MQIETAIDQIGRACNKKVSDDSAVFKDSFALPEISRTNTRMDRGPRFHNRIEQGRIEQVRKGGLPPQFSNFNAWAKSGGKPPFLTCSILVSLNLLCNMIEFEHELRVPSSDAEWLAFHAIRREVLFENRGKEDYIENHPDDSKTGNHPLALVYRGNIIGVVRVDVCETEAWLRRVAIREDVQRLGHGRILLRLAEAFAHDRGCSEVRTNAALEAVGFYLRCGYEQDNLKPSPRNSVSMRKSLR